MIIMDTAYSSESTVDQQEYIEPRCEHCGYLLVGLTTNRCPECGREFVWEEVLAPQPGRSDRIFIYLSQPPGKLLHIYATIGAILALLENAYFGWAILFLLSIFSWMIVIGVYGSKLFLAGMVRMSTHLRPLVKQQKHRNWLVIPLIFTAMLLLIYLNIPLYCSFFLSKSSMDRLALQATSSNQGTVPQTGWIGLYYSDRIVATKNGVKFSIVSVGFINKAGFAYCTTSPAPQYGESYQHFFGKWYIWKENI
ncbi:MAG: hypothetical protein HJJLKODD_02409 [Phycisphaerae bacterium]|nr:hypothetical protein [Phycisphaerae bacterium]